MFFNVRLLDKGKSTLVGAGGRKLVFLLWGLLCAGNCLAQTVVVVAKNSVIEQLNDRQIANIFLARTKHFPNGEKASPMELKHNEMRASFYRQISGKTLNQLNAYWTTLVFTGKGKPPRPYSDSRDLLEKFNRQPGAITYLSREQVTARMKVVYSFP